MEITKGMTFQIFSRPNKVFKVSEITPTTIHYIWTDEDSETYYYISTRATLLNPELVRFF